jgi:SOS response regulatory protein OraA/RecX
MIGHLEAIYLSNFFARSCTPAPADVQLASLTRIVDARKRRKNGIAGRKRRRRDDDVDEIEEEEDEEDDEDEQFKEALRQSLASKPPDAEEQRSKVRQFVDMGFEEEKVRSVLAACDWDTEVTLTTLLAA